MKRAAVVFAVGMILLLAGSVFAAVEVQGDFQVRGADQDYKYAYGYDDRENLDYSGLPQCPCDVCGNEFYTNVDLGYACADDYGNGQYIYFRYSMLMLDVSGGKVSIPGSAFVSSSVVVDGNIGIGTKTPAYALDIEKGVGMTYAKFGVMHPIYLIAAYPNVGFNAYYSGGWRYGKGSSSNYGGIIAFDIGTGDFAIQASSAKGNGDADMGTPKSLLTLKQDGSATLGYIPIGSSSNHLCASAGNSGQIERCGVSTRILKTDIHDLDMGMGTVGKLHPVLFNWKKTGQPDIGFIAEEVAAVSPVLATYNEQGDPEGVKYMNMAAVLVKAAQEQQQMISGQGDQIAQLQKALSERDSEIQSLKKAMVEIISRVGLIESSGKTVALK